MKSTYFYCNITSAFCCRFRNFFLAVFISISLHAAVIEIVACVPKRLPNGVQVHRWGGLQTTPQGSETAVVPLQLRLTQVTLPLDKREAIGSKNRHILPALMGVGLEGRTDLPTSKSGQLELGVEDSRVTASSNADRLFLEKISQCLPEGVQSYFHPTVLSIGLDQSGNLNAIPALNVDPSTLSADQLKMADQIIQATLQCGPYPVPDDHGSPHNIVVDFSTLANREP